MTWEPPTLDPAWDKKPDENGKVTVPISRKTARRLDALKRPGENDNDVLSRMFKGHAVEPHYATQSECRLSAARFPFHRPDVVKASVAIEEAFAKISPDSRQRVLLELAQTFPELKGRANLGDAVKDVISDFDYVEQAKFLSKLSEHAPTEKGFLDSMIETSDELVVPRHESKLQPIRDDLELLQRRKGALEHFIKLAEAPRLEKLGETGFHKLLDAFRRRDILIPHKEEIFPADLTECMNSNSPVFVVQHNWAAAFSKAQEFDGGEWRLPYDETIFEFRISGSRVIVGVATHENGTASSALMCVDTPVGWGLAAVYTLTDGKWKSTKHLHECDPIFDLCASQIRALAIALEAEVAATEVVRAPHKLNAKRARAGKLPILAYHVVNLARRERAERLPLPEGEERGTHASPRLHFRRGHWRHFASHKTWIKWMLVGDAELGFVDKHYRL